MFSRFHTPRPCGRSKPRSCRPHSRGRTEPCPSPGRWQSPPRGRGRPRSPERNRRGRKCKRWSQCKRSYWFLLSGLFPYLLYLLYHIFSRLSIVKLHKLLRFRSDLFVHLAQEGKWRYIAPFSSPSSKGIRAMPPFASLMVTYATPAVSPEPLTINFGGRIVPSSSTLRIMPVEQPFAMTSLLNPISLYFIPLPPLL